MKQIKGYSDYYIDESGVYSNKRYNMKKLKASVANTGYIQYCLYDDSKSGKPKYATFHQLLYLTYIGDYDKDKYTIDHKDNNKLNNKLNNFQLLTRGDNVIKSGNHLVGAEANSKKCTYLNIEYLSINECSRMNNIPRTSLRRILKKQF